MNNIVVELSTIPTICIVSPEALGSVVVNDPEVASLT
jgi:hypothetical protein